EQVELKCESKEKIFRRITRDRDKDTRSKQKQRGNGEQIVNSGAEPAPESARLCRSCYRIRLIFLRFHSRFTWALVHSSKWCRRFLAQFPCRFAADMPSACSAR